MGVMVPSVQNQQSLLIGGFSPTSLTGLIGWWDANVAASMTLGGASVVTAMADQSGAGNTMVTGGAPPTYNATGFNTSKPAIVFAGGQYLTKSGFALGTGNTLTAWYVGCAPASGFGSYGRLLSYVQGGGGNDFDQVGSFCINANGLSTTAVNLTRNSNNSTQTLSAYPAGHRVIFTITAAGVVTSYIDGVAGTPFTQAGNWVSAGGLSIGFGSGPAYWGGPVAEIGIATGDNTASVSSLDTYLKNKWGL